MELMDALMGLAPNGLPISRRERAAKDCQNTNDLVREAVGCIGGFGGRRFTAVSISTTYLTRSC